ncbi:helix-turn-helix domain-containing protein [Lactiplantibacillus plantarum]|uniref:helix-turn-helix domain-containing protein n=1 Tax=Lactiplantibacillus plantarum TaxID=1590 RepID=UPI002000B8B1|nr:helix-turn-helix transcriptional regulator [Lactiplantibacillus plantarum]
MHETKIQLPAGVTLKVTGVVQIDDADRGHEAVENVYAAVKYFETKMNLTDNELEMAAKVSKGTINNWKNSKGMNVSGLLKVAQTLNVGIHELLVLPPEE